MCGIVGYTGSRKAVPILLEGLQRLEYRGYDSAGIVIPENGRMLVLKQAGRLTSLQEKLNGIFYQATSGLGHTRWATHGCPSDQNAHPHTDCGGRFAVVHNGIIENYLFLREWLELQGHIFKSETDTEVIPHLVEHFYKGDLVEAVREVMKQIEGSYALAVFSKKEPGKLVAARQDSPLVIGMGKDECFLASDIPALLNHTRDTYILNDGELAILEGAKVKVLNKEGREVKKEIFKVKWEAKQAEKGGFEHFMLKEIYEQPKAIKDTLSGRITSDKNIALNELGIDFEHYKKIFITACGTAYHAGLIGKYLIEYLAGLPVEIDLASEFRYRRLILDENTLVVVISQSGETADSLAALREAKRRGAQVIAITNVVGSSIDREADRIIHTWAGPEIAVASTKAYTTQLIAVSLLALYLAKVHGRLPNLEMQKIVEEVKLLPEKAQTVLENTAIVKELAARYAHCEDAFFIGRGLDYAVALEGSLKLKEISYIHAEAYAAGELKHGTLALITEGVPVIALATQKVLFEKMMSNIREVKARGASMIALATTDLAEIEKVTDQVIYIPAVNPLLAPVLAVIPLQLLAYYMAVARGCDVDKPRNLAKSVTVE